MGEILSKIRRGVVDKYRFSFLQKESVESVQKKFNKSYLSIHNILCDLVQVSSIWVTVGNPIGMG